MDIGRVGSLFIRGSERVVQDRDMVFTLTFKERIDLRRLAGSYAALIASNNALRARLVAEGDGFSWQVVPHLGFARAKETVALRYSIQDERAIEVRVDHSVANGYGALFWLDQWLRLYGESTIDAVTVEPLRRQPGHATNWLARAFFTLLYVVAFLLRSRGKRAASETVDLTRGKAPGVQTLGYAARAWRFSSEETARMVAAAKEDGCTFTEMVCAAVARALFAAEPDKRRVLVSLPVDLGAEEPSFAPTKPGNYTGSLIVQLFRDRPLEAQIQRAFKGFRRGVPLGLARIVAAFAKSERDLFTRFADQAHAPAHARAPFENFSCALSSLGVVKHEAIRRHVARISAHGCTQTIFLGVMTLSGELSIEMSVARDLFDEHEAFLVGDAIRDDLLARAREVAPRVLACPDTVGEWRAQPVV